MEANPNSGGPLQGQFLRQPTVIAWIVALMAAAEIQAQLAITEVMSQASTNLGTGLVVPKSDFWELTNFGTNIISLDGYSFSDRDSDPSSRVGDPFRNCFIGPGESIIFVRTDAITNRQGFFNWWGSNNLRADLQVRIYPKKPGFDAEVDSVQLFDQKGELVDRVNFGRALRGHTFVYHPETGEFGSFSTIGVNGSFQAVLADDVGSPGLTIGAVPLSIIQQPVSVTDDAGADAEFSVGSAGLPRPSYQWFFNGTEIPGARRSPLTISNLQPQHAGDYSVRVGNGLVSILSTSATLAVNTNPSPATIVIPPDDALVFEGQTAVFLVKARGFPPPVLQWQRDGTDIPGATNNSLVIPAASLTLNGTLYTIRVQNIYASTNASAQLYVTAPPKLAITEVMTSVAGGPNSGHTDWFELTNLDTNAVNLFGYRFSDRYSFELCFRITNSLVVQPGESVIFVERLAAEEFKQWWGSDRLPADLKITTYQGLGFSSSGDIINFWNGAETDPYSPVVSVGFLEAISGFSMRFIPPDFYFIEDSVLGLDGAFPAATGGDVGSPGYMTNPPPRFVAVTRNEAGVTARCRVTEGKSYDLRFKTNVSDSDWVTVDTYLADDWVIAIPLLFDIEESHRVFRLEEAE